MSNDKALAIIPRTVDEVRTLASTFAKSALLPPDLRGKEADVFVSIMAGQELGLPPMAALRGVHIVKGKPVLAADTMVGIILSSGIAEYFDCVEESPMSVTYATKRRGSPHEQRTSWTLEDARIAGLSGDNWKKYPRAMLKARCKAMLARDVYPDVLAGCYTHDEAEAFSPDRAPAPVNDNSDVQDAEVVQSDGVTPGSDLISQIDYCESEAALEALVPQLAKLPPAAKAKARKAYDARRAWIRSVAREQQAAVTGEQFTFDPEDLDSNVPR